MYFLLMTLIFFKKKLPRGIPTWIVLIYCGSCHQGGNARTISSARWSVELVYISNALSVFIWVFVFHDTAGLSLMMWFFLRITVIVWPWAAGLFSCELLAAGTWQLSTVFFIVVSLLESCWRDLIGQVPLTFVAIMHAVKFVAVMLV